MGIVAQSIDIREGVLILLSNSRYRLDNELARARVCAGESRARADKTPPLVVRWVTECGGRGERRGINMSEKARVAEVKLLSIAFLQGLFFR